MKKISILALAAALLLFAASCSNLSGNKDGAASDTQADESAAISDGGTGTESGAGIPNPLVVVDDSAAIKEQTGADMKIPPDSTELLYMVIGGKVGQIIFEYDGIQYTYRGAKGLSGTELHGVYGDYGEPQTFEAGGLTIEAAGFGDNGTLATWTAGDINYSLFTKSAVDLNTLQTVLGILLG